MKKRLTFIILTAVFCFAFYAVEGQKSNILVEKGLAYLASVQSTSKGFGDLTGPSIDPLNKPGLESKIAGHWQSNPGITALCLQAFIANGHGVADPVYGTNVTNAINYLLAIQVTSGDHTGAMGTWQYGYETAMAIVALKSALNSAGLSGALKTQVENALDLALNYYTQDVNAGWNTVSWRYHRYYTSPLNGDMSVNQWVFLALDAMGYTDKDIWNKIYGYINTKKASSGNKAWIGYQDPGTWARGNSSAGIWGLKLAYGKGVIAAENLANMMYNYLEQNTLADLFPASQWTYTGNYVYDGGGFYYYTYELAKALALGGKINFSGSPWYEHLYVAIDGQKNIDGAGNYYWDGYGGQGAPMETALALLALQTGTVPTGSKIVISFDSDLSKRNDCFTFDVFDEFGNQAGQNIGTWYTNIPNSFWTINPNDFKLTIDLEASANFSVMVNNICPDPQDAELCFRAFIENNLIDEECFQITNPPSSPIGASAFINAIGGLNVIMTSPPAVVPIMQLVPNVIALTPFEYSHAFNFEFEVQEIGGDSPLTGIDVFASNLVDQYGNVIPNANFTLIPSTIPIVAPGGSVNIQGTLVTPDSFSKAYGYFQGVITVQTPTQSRAITFTVGDPPAPSVPLATWALYLGIFLIGLFVFLRFIRT